MAAPYCIILSKIGDSLLLLIVKDDNTLVLRPAATPVSERQLWKKVALGNSKYKLVSKAQNLELKFAVKGKAGYVTDKGGSEVVFPNNFVKIKESAPPQYVLGIAGSSTVANTGVVSWDDIDIDDQLWLIIERE